MKQLINLAIFLAVFVTTSLAQVVISPATSYVSAVTGGACTNQVATAIGTSAEPTCTTITSAYVNAITGSGSFVLATNPTFTKTPVAIATLSACGAGTANQTMVVNDALLPALGSLVADGGLLTVGVICKNGTGWVVY